MALGPGPGPGSVRSGTFSRPGYARGGGDQQASARWRVRARRGHARGGRTGRGAQGPTLGRLLRSQGHAPTGGSRSHPRPRPAPALRTALRSCRSALTPAQARAPGHPGAPASSLHGRPPPPLLLRKPSLRSQADKAPARGPLHPLPETAMGVFVTCRWAPSPAHPHMPTHPRPRTHRQAGRKPALLLGPSHSQIHAEGHSRSASPSHVEGPQHARGPEGGLGRRPRRAASGWGREGLVSGLAPRPVACPPLPACPASSGANRCAPRARLVGRLGFPAGRRRLAV